MLERAVPRECRQRLEFPGIAEGAVLAADLNLAPLGPGDYIIELSVTTDGGKSSTQLLALRVRN